MGFIVSGILIAIFIALSYKYMFILILGLFIAFILWLGSKVG